MKTLQLTPNATATTSQTGYESHFKSQNLLKHLHICIHRD